MTPKLTDLTHPILDTYARTRIKDGLRRMDFAQQGQGPIHSMPRAKSPLNTWYVRLIKYKSIIKYKNLNYEK